MSDTENFLAQDFDERKSVQNGAGRLIGDLVPKVRHIGVINWIGL